MKYIFRLVGLALVLFVVSPALAYEWHLVPIDPDEPYTRPVYEIQFEVGSFWGGNYFAGTEDGVYRGDGMQGNWRGFGLDYPGLHAYSILCLQGSGWSKHIINEERLFGATGVGVGDFDGSGFRDVAVAAKEDGHAVLWYKNPRPLSPLFWAADTVDSPAFGAREVSIFDIDGDDDLDIAVAVRDEDQIAWYEAQEDPHEPGGISWVRHDVGDPLGGPRGVFVADINNDTRPDIVAGGMNDNTVVWIEQPENAGDMWVTHYVDTDLTTVKGVFAIDIDGDDDLDIVAAGRDVGHVVWYEKLNAEPDWQKHFIDTDLPGAVSVWCGELNGDDRPDVAATGREAGMVVVYEAPEDPTGTWARVVVDDDLTTACAIAAGDIDGDGRTDLVATGKTIGTVAWYRNSWSEGWPWQKRVIDDILGLTMGVTTGDLDDDGDLDVVATCLEGDVACYFNDLGDHYCAFSDGTGACESDGLYRWRDLRAEWEATFWCARPFFIEEHPLVPDLFFVGNHSGLFVSEDMDHWQEEGAGVLPDTVRCIWFHPVDPHVLMVGTDRGLYRKDQVSDWHLIEDTPRIPVHDIEEGYYFSEPNGIERVFAALGNGSFDDGVYRSLDGGMSWDWLFGWPMPTSLIQEVYVGASPPRIMFVGTAEDGIQRMHYDGAHVGNMNEGLGCLSINRMRYDPFIVGGAHLYTCTQRGLYVCLIPYDPTDVPPMHATSGLSCYVHPNPWRESVCFSVSGLSRGETPRLRLFDPAGREVWRFHDGRHAGGVHTMHWDGESLHGGRVPPGVFFYRLEVPGRIESGKVLRLR